MRNSILIIAFVTGCALTTVHNNKKPSEKPSVFNESVYYQGLNVDIDYDHDKDESFKVSLIFTLGDGDQSHLFAQASKIDVYFYNGAKHGMQILNKIVSNHDVRIKKATSCIQKGQFTKCDPFYTDKIKPLKQLIFHVKLQDGDGYGYRCLLNKNTLKAMKSHRSKLQSMGIYRMVPGVKYGRCKMNSV